MMDHGECWVCGRSVALRGAAYPYRMDPHPSRETNALCAGSDLEWKDPIL
jgi:hypothetical protein